jgi:signal transduction histidine kinase
MPTRGLEPINAPTRMGRGSWGLVFGLIVVSFVAATSFSQWRMRAIDQAAGAIAFEAAPSIERLAAARGEMRQLQVLLSAFRGPTPRGADLDARTLGATRQRIDTAIADYLVLPVFPEERPLWEQVLRDKDALDTASSQLEAEAARDDAAGVRTAAISVDQAAQELRGALTRDIELNAQHSHDLAQRIQSTRAQAAFVAFGLDAVCVAITAFAAVRLRAAIGSYTRLVEEHRRLHEERASELEQFAGRVAHDILSPLGTVGFALGLAAKSTDANERAQVLARGTSAVERVKVLVNGLLGFARAGAKPEPGASTEVDATIADLLAELTAAAAERGIELVVTDQTSCSVACDPGVLASLVENLARNAIKYIGDAEVRRITIRSEDKGDRVRIEVADTGPGLPPGFEEDVFEPYVRGRNTAQPGIGLGLATVKRMAEAHGGRVGVRSVPGAGATFWFELPKPAAQA